MDDKLREYLIATAAGVPMGVMDFYGQDDFTLGVHAGKVSLARLLLAKFGGPNDASI